jgi:tol-pal system protein YbgF
MTRHRFCARLACTLPAALLAAALFSAPGTALAQQRGFLDNLFNRGQQQQPQQQQPAPQGAQPQVAQVGDGGGVQARLDRIENALRQLTGTVEQLQHQNQLMHLQLKRLQDDTEYRFQKLGVKGRANDDGNGARSASTGARPAAPAGQSDAFNPALHPNAPGVPHTLGNPQAIAAPEPQQGQNGGNEQLGGAPGGRTAGAPLDLSTLAGNGPAPQQPPGQVANAAPANAALGNAARGNGASMRSPQGAQLPPAQGGQLPAPPPRNPNATGAKLATLPPSATAKDEYELAYGYVLHKDYGLAVQAFRDFLSKYPHEKRSADAQFWMGEAQFQQQHYRDAAETFLAVSTKYAHSGKAPNALLRLGQSLAALHQKEAACATLAEVGRKYPHASSSIKRNVAREQKRTHC